jgi:hypothetical protein
MFVDGGLPSVSRKWFFRTFNASLKIMIDLHLEEEILTKISKY